MANPTIAIVLRILKKKEKNSLAFRKENGNQTRQNQYVVCLGYITGVLDNNLINIGWGDYVHTKNSSTLTTYYSQWVEIISEGTLSFLDISIFIIMNIS